MSKKIAEELPSEGLLNEESVAMLLKNAGPRRSAPPEIKAEVFQTAEDAWQQKWRRRRARRRAWYGVAAALVAVAVGWGFLGGSFEETSPAVTVATVEAWFGEQSAHPFAVGESLLAGAEVTTLDTERAALRLGEGVSVRLGESARVRLVAAATIELLSGAIYVDTGRAASEATTSMIEVRTRFGMATDIGTQFEARLDAEQLHLRVREGRVRLEAGEQTLEAGVGSVVIVDADGALERAEASDGDWTWAIEAAPSRHLKGQSVAVILRWVERETGWQVRYQDAALAAEAEEIITRGSLEGLRPTEIADILLPTAGLEAELAEQVLWVRRAP